MVMRTGKLVGARIQRREDPVPFIVIRRTRVTLPEHTREGGVPLTMVGRLASRYPSVLVQ